MTLTRADLDHAEREALREVYCRMVIEDPTMSEAMCASRLNWWLQRFAAVSKQISLP